MIGMLRLAVFGFIGLSVIFLIALVYSRSVHREELEKRWDAAPPEGGDAEARGAFIETGMREYEKSLRYRLLWLIYVVPMAVILVTAWLVNSQ